MWNFYFKNIIPVFEIEGKNLTLDEFLSSELNNDFKVNI